MVKPKAPLLIGFLVLVSLVSCQPVQREGALVGDERGQLSVDMNPYPDAIPAEYGDAIGVASVSGNASWTQVWFMKPDKSIVVVWVNASSGKISKQIVTIPRR